MCNLFGSKWTFKMDSLSSTICIGTPDQGYYRLGGCFNLTTILSTSKYKVLFHFKQNISIVKLCTIFDTSRPDMHTWS